MLGLLRFLRGYITVVSNTPFPERFFNICTKSNILIWDIVRTEDSIVFKMAAKDLFKIKNILRKCGMRVTINQKSGLPFFMFRHRKQYSFLIGMSIAYLMIWFLSLFVWKIQWQGNSYYTDETLHQYLENLGIREGMYMDEVDCDYINKKIRNDFEDVIWVSSEKSGTCLTIFIKENDNKEQEEAQANAVQTGAEGRADTGAAQSGISDTGSMKAEDIIAGVDGTIESIIMRSGTPKVKKGDEVKAGDVLVSSEVPVYNDAKEVTAVHYVSADADIMIRTQLPYEDTVQKNMEYRIYTGKKREFYSMLFLDTDYDLAAVRKNFDRQVIATETRQLLLTKDFYLPIYIRKTRIFEYYSEQGSYTDEEISKILSNNYERFLKKLQKKGVQIVHDGVTIDITDVNATMSGNIDVIIPDGTRTAHISDGG